MKIKFVYEVDQLNRFEMVGVLNIIKFPMLRSLKILRLSVVLVRCSTLALISKSITSVEQTT